MKRKLDMNFQAMYPILAKQWHPILNASLKPSDVAPYYNARVWWICNGGHEYHMSPNRKVMGRGCPKCSKQISIIEYCLYLCILKSYPESIIQFKVNGKWKVDIFVKEINTCVEYDGYRWHLNTVERDIRKNKVLNDLGFKVVRLREEGLPLISAKGRKQISVKSSRNIEGFKQIKKNVIEVCKKLNKSLAMKINLQFTMDDYLIALEEIHVKPKSWQKNGIMKQMVT